MGTPKVWLAQYLAEQSPTARDATVSVYVSFARLMRGDGKTVDVNEASEPDELFAQVSRIAADQAAFVRLDSPPLSRTRMPVNYGYHTVSHVPGQVFDAFVLLPEGKQQPPERF